jgi:NAD(P)-dependent dehydrogenase (short-subunit alcohol dehydrogenase family)
MAASAVHVVCTTGLAMTGQWMPFAAYSLAGYFVSRKLARGPSMAVPKYSLEGKTALITGANTGIGFQTALEMARQGCQIIFACRSQERAEDAMADISSQLHHTHLHFVHLDLASFKSVENCAAKVDKLLSEGKVKSLDYIINNAGGLWPHTNLSEDGFDISITANHLSPVLLTERLLPHLIESKGRIINVASTAHRTIHELKFGVGGDPLPYNARLSRLLFASQRTLPEYGLSKAGNIIYAKQLARRLEGTGVQVCSLHPGGVDTEVYRNLPKAAKVVISSILAPIAFKTPEQGAWTTLTCVFTKKLIQGEYYADCSPRPEWVMHDFDPKDIEAFMDSTFRAIKMQPLVCP